MATMISVVVKAEKKEEILARKSGNDFNRLLQRLENILEAKKAKYEKKWLGEESENWYCVVKRSEVIFTTTDFSAAKEKLDNKPERGQSQAIIPMKLRKAGDPEETKKEWGDDQNMWWWGVSDIKRMQEACEAYTPGSKPEATPDFTPIAKSICAEDETYDRRRGSCKCTKENYGPENIEGLRDVYFETGTTSCEEKCAGTGQEWAPYDNVDYCRCAYGYTPTYPGLSRDSAGYFLEPNSCRALCNFDANQDFVGDDICQCRNDYKMQFPAEQKDKVTCQ